MKRKVAEEAISALSTTVERVMVCRGLKTEWLRHVCDDNVPLETDCDWPLYCAVWLFEQDVR